MEINSEDTPSKLTVLLKRIEEGEEIVIRRYGKKVARIKPDGIIVPFPGLKKFRETIDIQGEPLSRTVISMREEERF